VSECATSARNSPSSRHDFTSIRHAIVFRLRDTVRSVKRNARSLQSSTFQPPLIPSDSAAPVCVVDSHEQARESGNEIVDLQHCKSLES
jgi:hypothetical protein